MEINCQKIDQLEQIIPYFAGTGRLDSLVKFGGAAEKSLAEYSMNRPPMVDVLWNMQYALKLQEIFLSIVCDVVITVCRTFKNLFHNWRT